MLTTRQRTETMSKKMPVRRCVGCQEMKNKKEMIRVIRTPEGEFELDATGRKTDAALIFAPAGNVWKRR